MRFAYLSHLSPPSALGMHLALAFAHVVQAFGPFCVACMAILLGEFGIVQRWLPEDGNGSGNDEEFGTVVKGCDVVVLLCKSQNQLS